MLLQKTENDKQKEAGDGPFQRATIWHIRKETQEER